MDEQTLEYILQNIVEFVGGLAGGTYVGYTSSRSKKGVFNKPELSKLGYATLSNFIMNFIQMGLAHLGIGPETTIMKATQGEIGGIMGWYVGFHVGGLIDKVLEKIYIKSKT